MFHLTDLTNAGHLFSIAGGDWSRRDLSRPHAECPVPVALVAPAAVAVLIAGGTFDATAALPTLTPAGQRITDDVGLVLAPALPVAVASAAARLTRLRAKPTPRLRDPAGQQTTDTRGRRLQQPPSPGARSGQLQDGIERFVIHVVSPFGVYRHRINIHCRARARSAVANRAFLLVHRARGNGSQPDSVYLTGTGVSPWPARGERWRGRVDGVKAKN